MKKGLLGWEAIVRILIAIIVVAFIITCTSSLAKDYFSETEGSKKSFEGFALKVEKAIEWEEKEYQEVRLDIDKNSYILFFNSGSNEIKISDSLYVKRPSTCEGKIGCLCLCRDYSLEDVEDAYDNFVCNDYVCKKVGEVEFKSSVGDSGIGGFRIEGSSEKVNTYYIEKGEGDIVGFCKERENSCFT